jgi:hypothetical protein
MATEDSSSSNNKRARLLSLAPQEQELKKEGERQEDKTPTPQTLVYVRPRYFGDEDNNNYTDDDGVADFMTLLIKGYIYNATTEEVVKAGGDTGENKRVLWTRSVTPWPVKFVKPALDMKVLLEAKTPDVFLDAFQTSALKQQMARKTGPGLVHGWLFNLDDFLQTKFNAVSGFDWPIGQAEFALRIIQKERATWADFHRIHFNGFVNVRAALHLFLSGVFPVPRTSNDIVNAAISAFESAHQGAEVKNPVVMADAKQKLEEWNANVMQVVPITTNKPTTVQIERLSATMTNILGYEMAKSVMDDLQRLIRADSKLGPNDYRYTFANFALGSINRRRALITCILLLLVRDPEGPWNQRNWIVEVHQSSMNSRFPGAVLNSTLFDESRLPDALTTAMGYDSKTAWESLQTSKERDTIEQIIQRKQERDTIKQIIQMSPQFRKDQIVGNFFNWEAKEREKRAVGHPSNPARTLSGWGQKDHGTKQVVFSFLGKATDTQRRQEINRFEEVPPPSDRRALIGNYGPFLRNNSQRKN